MTTMIKTNFKYYVDAGTSWSKVLEINETNDSFDKSLLRQSDIALTCNTKIKNIEKEHNLYIVPSKDISKLNLEFNGATGHMVRNKLSKDGKYENEIIALAYGAQKTIEDWHNATIIDLGSRDTKWVRFKDGKYKDLDWNTSCGSATGATVEMLCKFYNVNPSQIDASSEKYPVTCGVFAMEKIMDDIATGVNTEIAIAKYIHGIAYNAWNFAQKPEQIYLSGGFCENSCFVESMKKYCDVKQLGRFVLLNGLI